MLLRRPGPLLQIQFAEELAVGALVIDQGMQRLDLHALLLHRIAVADRHRAVLERLTIDGDAERRTDGILTTVALADRILLVVDTL